jgi:hypothetical protein
MEDSCEELLISVSNLRRQCDARKCFGQKWCGTRRFVTYMRFRTDVMTKFTP